MTAEELYGLPLERFVEERTALVRALRRGGERDEATRVSKLPKPSLAAWAVNQLIRTQRRLTDELFEAGDALKQAQADVMAGRGNAHSLRETADRERSAVSALTDVARGLLTSDGHSLTATTLERVSDTLHAAALQDAARAQVQDGCLTRELRHVGLGENVFSAAMAPPPSRKTARPPKARDAGSVPDEAATRLREAERVLAEQAKRLQEARREEAEARRAAERADKRRQAAADERARAADVLAAAEQALERAVGEAETAETALERARAAAEAAEAAHREAEQERKRL